MARTITWKTKGKAKEPPKDASPQEPKKGENQSLMWEEIISPTPFYCRMHANHEI